ncbi:uncharacterized protein KY384_005720 [Bacidia gigantensis]|uniref:uncharacterized protein n=1 Tax=Bacidia gigantensis TaxID=2732470 RepID=UPI001D0407A1|nr:uncharacterized protein KY384_005720 [Bacidia gigantensis]KAG8529085.1 hypothetical protein KY384_005720 [Bacidia gigantensis]
MSRISLENCGMQVSESLQPSFQFVGKSGNGHQCFGVLHVEAHLAATSTVMVVNQRRLFLSKDSGRHIFEQHIEYLDDLSQLLDALEYKEEYLRKFFIVERQDPTHDRLTKMIELAISDLQVARKQFSKLVEDLRTNLNIGFQLRTISQNEATLLAESNNRAILVFTLVTIIFLPLSFFTSYYGMNLPDVAKTDKTQAWFWKVCGTSTFGIVGLTILFGFKNRWTEWLFWTVAREWDIRDETVDLSDYYG